MVFPKYLLFAKDAEPGSLGQTFACGSATLAQAQVSALTSSSNRSSFDLLPKVSCLVLSCFPITSRT